MNVPLLKLVNVRKKLSILSDGETISNVILPNISLEIIQGEFTAITGPSGSGKTTLLYLMGMLDQPTSGSIYLEGDEVTLKNEEELAEIRNNKLGFVYQFHFLLPEFSSLENVMMPMLARGRYSISAARERAKELLHLVDLSNRLENKPNQLSGGQQQRVAIARALANEPIMILADEPTGNLDSKNSELVYQMFLRLNTESNQTIVVVTHDESFAGKTKRNIHLVDGEIVRDTILNK
ncbi:MAG TPA: lipoprotein-releasing system ATP-binding protein LolD [Bacteroidetes bacterium]|nr:lipoprotein-releasing system ATP-binding protein LolD [Bacteroidota bacterium]